MPVLFLIGEKDTLCHPKFAYDLFQSLENVDKQIITFPEGKHEPMLDYEQKQLIEEIWKWRNLKKNKEIPFEMPKYIKFTYSTIKYKKLLKICFIIFVLILFQKKKSDLKQFFSFFKNLKKYI